MAGADPGVIVRRARRFDVVLPASIGVREDHQDLIRFGPRAGDRSGWIEGDLIDIGTAGAGFMGTTFMPKGTKVTLRLFHLGKRDEDPMLEIQGTIVRVVMTDRRPAYLLGVGFDPEDTEAHQKIEELVELLIDAVGEQPPRDEPERDV